MTQEKSYCRTRRYPHRNLEIARQGKRLLNRATTIGSSLSRSRRVNTLSPGPSESRNTPYRCAFTDRLLDRIQPVSPMAAQTRAFSRWAEEITLSALETEVGRGEAALRARPRSGLPTEVLKNLSRENSISIRRN